MFTQDINRPVLAAGAGCAIMTVMGVALAQPPWLVALAAAGVLTGAWIFLLQQCESRTRAKLQADQSSLHDSRRKDSAEADEATGECIGEIRAQFRSEAQTQLAETNTVMVFLLGVVFLLNQSLLLFVHVFDLNKHRLDNILSASHGPLEVLQLLP